MTDSDAQLTLDQLPVSVVRLDRSYRVTYTNTRFSGFLRRTPEEILGFTCLELGMAASDWEHWQRAVALAFATGHSGAFEYVGHIPTVGQALVELRYAPAPAPSVEAITSVVVCAVVIEEIRQLRQALQTQQELFSSFMDHVPAIAWMRDAESRYVYLNKNYRDRYGRHAADRIGRMPEDVWPADVAAQFRANDRRVMAEQRALQVLETAPDPDGSPRTWLNVKFPFLAPDGSQYLGGVGMDVTESRKHEARLTRAQKLEGLGLLAAGAAHDFNNLMTIVQGNVDLLRPDVPMGTDAADALRAISDAADRAAALCQQMLAFAGRNPSSAVGTAPVPEYGESQVRFPERLAHN
jgi:PAS domain S-box-containing protein